MTVTHGSPQSPLFDTHNTYKVYIDADMIQTTIPTLHNLAHSQSLRVLWALEEIQLANPDFKYNLKNYARSLGKTGLEKVHSLGKAPALTLETTDGSPPPTIQLEPGVLSESALIMQFINDEYANGLWTPVSEEDKRRDTYFSAFAGSSLTLKSSFAVAFEMPGQILPFPINLLFKMTAYPLMKNFLNDLQDLYTIMEEALSDEKPYFSGAKLGLADIHISFGMDTSEHRGYISFEGGKFPKLKRWGERIRSRVAYQRAVAKSGGYNLKTGGFKSGWIPLLTGKMLE